MERRNFWERQRDSFIKDLYYWTSLGKYFSELGHLFFVNTNVWIQNHSSEMIPMEPSMIFYRSSQMWYCINKCKKHRIQGKKKVLTESCMSIFLARFQLDAAWLCLKKFKSHIETLEIWSSHKVYILLHTRVLTLPDYGNRGPINVINLFSKTDDCIKSYTFT